MPTLSDSGGSLAIRCEGIGKRYRIGAHLSYRTLRDTISEFAQAPFRRALSRGHTPTTDERDLWAVRDVSLEMHHGEVLGIIGRNGSGKSTLLKILSRITKPTEGRADIGSARQFSRSRRRFSSGTYREREYISQRGDLRHDPPGGGAQI